MALPSTILSWSFALNRGMLNIEGSDHASGLTVASDLTLNVKNTDLSVLSPARLRSLEAAAVAAPSADNRHMFRLEADGDTLRLVATSELLGAPLGRRILGLISIGAVAENLSLRAARLGIQVETTWRVNAGMEALLAEMRCRDGPVLEDSKERAIEQRQSNRRLIYRGPRLQEDVRNEMTAHAIGLDGAALAWLDGPAQRKRALRLIRWAESERFRNRALHKELFESIRFDVGWNRAATEGLSPGSLELPLFERPAFLLLRHWGVQRTANLFFAHRFIGFRAADLPCRMAPHLCAISAEGGLGIGAINAGRLLQRVWLHATDLGLAVQVFAASGLYALEGCAPIDAELRRRLASGWKELIPKGQTYLVFRMGYAKSASLHAGRPSPADFIVLT